MHQSCTTLRYLMPVVMLTVTSASVGYGIHYGAPIGPEEFPSVGQVLVRAADGSVSSGTGTLIADDVILTAAHVIQSAPGPTNIFFVLDSAPDQPVMAVAYRANPDYINVQGATGDGLLARHTGPMRSSIAHDIALVKLSRPLDVAGEFFELAPQLPRRDAQLTVIGYGMDERGRQKGRSVRMKGTLECLGESKGVLLLGGGEGKRQTTDRGDSGGPVLLMGGGRAQLVGLTQGYSLVEGFEDHDFDEYGFYVSIPRWRTWAQHQLEELQQLPRPEAGQTWAYVPRRAPNDLRMAFTRQQLSAIAQIGVDKDELAKWIVRRGVSEPLGNDLIEGLSQAGLPMKEILVAVKFD